MIKNLLIIFAVYKAYQYFNSQPAQAAAPAPVAPGAIPTQDQLRDLAISKGTQIFQDNVIPFVKGKLQ